MHLLRTLNKENGTTFLMITHDQELGKKTDRVINFKDGVIDGERRRFII